MTLLEQIEELDKTLENDSYKSWCYARLTIANIRKNLNEHPSSLWISINDRLPEKEGMYLTFTKNKVSESIGFTLFSDGSFMSSFVTHWAIINKPTNP